MQSSSSPFPLAPSSRFGLKRRWNFAGLMVLCCHDGSASTTSTLPLLSNHCMLPGTEGSLVETLRGGNQIISNCTDENDRDYLGSAKINSFWSFSRGGRVPQFPRLPAHKLPMGICSSSKAPHPIATNPTTQQSVNLSKPLQCANIRKMSHPPKPGHQERRLQVATSNCNKETEPRHQNHTGVSISFHTNPISLLKLVGMGGTESVTVLGSTMQLLPPMLLARRILLQVSCAWYDYYNGRYLRTMYMKRLATMRQYEILSSLRALARMTIQLLSMGLISVMFQFWFSKVLAPLCRSWLSSNQNSRWSLSVVTICLYSLGVLWVLATATAAKIADCGMQQHPALRIRTTTMATSSALALFSRHHQERLGQPHTVALWRRPWQVLGSVLKDPESWFTILVDLTQRQYTRHRPSSQSQYVESSSTLSSWYRRRPRALVPLFREPDSPISLFFPVFTVATSWSPNHNSPAGSDIHYASEGDNHNGRYHPHHLLPMLAMATYLGARTTFIVVAATAIPAGTNSGANVASGSPSTLTFCPSQVSMYYSLAIAVYDEWKRLFLGEHRVMMGLLWSFASALTWFLLMRRMRLEMMLFLKSAASAASNSALMSVVCVSLLLLLPGLLGSVVSGWTNAMVYRQRNQLPKQSKLW